MEKKNVNYLHRDRVLKTLYRMEIEFLPHTALSESGIRNISIFKEWAISVHIYKERKAHSLDKMQTVSTV